MNLCLYCNRPVRPKLTKDKKRHVGSAWMMVNDKKELFCRMRCAARYGINVASRRGS